MLNEELGRGRKEDGEAGLAAPPSSGAAGRGGLAVSVSALESLLAGSEVSSALCSLNTVKKFGFELFKK